MWTTGGTHRGQGLVCRNKCFIFLLPTTPAETLLSMWKMYAFGSADHLRGLHLTQAKKQQGGLRYLITNTRSTATVRITRKPACHRGKGTGIVPPAFGSLTIDTGIQENAPFRKAINAVVARLVESYKSGDLNDAQRALLPSLSEGRLSWRSYKNEPQFQFKAQAAPNPARGDDPQADPFVYFPTIAIERVSGRADDGSVVLERIDPKYALDYFEGDPIVRIAISITSVNFDSESNGGVVGADITEMIILKYPKDPIISRATMSITAADLDLVEGEAAAGGKRKASGAAATGEEKKKRSRKKDVMPALPEADEGVPTEDEGLEA